MQRQHLQAIALGHGATTSLGVANFADTGEEHQHVTVETVATQLPHGGCNLDIESVPRGLRGVLDDLRVPYVDLGIILARSGRREEAVSVFEQGLLVLPGHPLLQRNLDLLTHISSLGWSATWRRFPSRGFGVSDTLRHKCR